MKFGMMFQLQTPRPIDAEQWHEHDELKIYHQALEQVDAAMTVRVRDGRLSVTDGPFAETKELVAGYWVWQVRSMEEAVEWAKRCPNPMPGPSDLEIRPFWEPEDFDPEIVAQVNAHREKIATEGK